LEGVHPEAPLFEGRHPEAPLLGKRDPHIGEMNPPVSPCVSPKGVHGETFSQASPIPGVWETWGTCPPPRGTHPHGTLYQTSPTWLSLTSSTYHSLVAHGLREKLFLLKY
jgi:hypothetical protein